MANFLFVIAALLVLFLVLLRKIDHIWHALSFGAASPKKPQNKIIMALISLITRIRR